MRRSDVILSVVNAVLTLGAVIAVGVAILWWRAPRVVDQWGERLVSSYVDEWQARLKGAEVALREGRDREGRSRLIQILRDLDEIRPGDRLAPMKTRAYRTLIVDYDRSGDYDEALRWLDAWIEFDENDITARVGRGLALLRIPGREAEGEAMISELYARVPEAESVARAHAALLRESGHRP